MGRPVAIEKVLVLPRRIRKRLGRMLRQFKEQARHSVIPTYALHELRETSRPLAERFSFIDKQFVAGMFDISPEYAALVRQQSEAAIAHCFDLLGSGPVVVAHGVSCVGVEGYVYSAPYTVVPDRAGKWLAGRINRSNLEEAQRIWSFVSAAYRPIDWQLDFKSGYRWSEKTWFRAILFGRFPGVDIKVPWELARMQHLPLLALAAHFAKSGLNEMRDPQLYCCEVRDQILDFIATNPPGFGVNWSCAMDVGIRVANMLVAHDILKAAGLSFGAEVDQIFEASVRAHARHLAANLEWAPHFRGNHYLADIAGLLFASAYLGADPETDAWLAFATEELFVEMAYQFHDDGSNFEASVCYHRLSAEICLWALALIDGLPQERRQAFARTYRWEGSAPPARIVGLVPLQTATAHGPASPVSEWCRQRVAAMARFTRAMTRPDGLVVQFGDNDSGRFITLGSGEQVRAGGDPADPAWSLDHCAFLAMADSFLGQPATEVCALLLSGLASGSSRKAAEPVQEKAAAAVPADDASWTRYLDLWEGSPAQSRWTTEFLVPGGQLGASLAYQYFAGMGVCVFRAPKVFLAIRCGEIGLEGLGAHAHCDQLAIELVVDGADVVRDPGSYLYTALVHRRNDYRSVKAHHAPRSGDREPANLKLGEFDLRGAAEGECLYIGPKGYVGRHAGYGSWIYRMISFGDGRIVVRDFSPQGLSVTDPTPETMPLSQGYGRLLQEMKS